MSTSNEFWIPKSVFKGVNADGSKFSATEWNFNSIGNLGGETFTGLLVAAFIAIIASPLTLLLAILTYDGRVGALNLVGIIIGSYFLYDANHSWVVTSGSNIFLSGSAISFLVAANIASVACHLILLVLTIVFGDRLNVFPIMWILLFGMIGLFMLFFSFGTTITEKHGTYEPYRIEQMKKEREESLGINKDYGDFKSQEERDAYFAKNEFNR